MGISARFLFPRFLSNSKWGRLWFHADPCEYNCTPVINQWITMARAEASRTWWIPRLTRWCCCPPLSKGLLTFRQCTSASTVVIKLFFQARVSSEGELSLWTKESGLLSNHRKSLRVPTKPSWWQLLFGDEGINLWDPGSPMGTCGRLSQPTVHPLKLVPFPSWITGAF